MNKSDVSTCVSRRTFIKGAGVAAGAVAATGLVGCGGNDGGSADGSAKKVLRFGQGNAKLGLDMQKSTNSGSSSIADCIFESPLRWTEDNELVACLLTEVPTFEDDGVTLHCTLKEGVKFHNGETLTANDVKYSFERMFKPETAAKSTYMYDRIVGAQDMLDGKATELAGLTVEDDTHFTFTLESPMTAFISNLGISYAHIFPAEACEAAGDKWGWGTECIGTGKYKVVSNDDTTEVVLERFDDYHDGTPNLDEVHIVFFDDNNTKLMSYKNGDIDWCDLSPDLLAQYQADEDVKDQITLYTTLGCHFVNLNLKEGMGLEDARVREALSLAINRQELIDTVLSGAGEAASGVLAPATPGNDPTAELPYDPERAKQLLAEAGVSGLKLDCKCRKGQYEKYMTAVQAYWAAIGVEMSLTIQDSAVWSSDWAEGNLQVTCVGWFPLYPDADNHLYTYFYSTSAMKKSSFYDSPEFDKLMDEGRVSQDADERKQLYTEADNLLSRVDFATIPLYWPKGAFVAKPYVKNAKVGNLIYHMNDIDIDTTDESYSA